MLLKQNWQHYSTMAKKPTQYALHYKNCATSSLQLRFKWTTAQQLALQMIASNKSDQRQLICAFTESMTVCDKDNSTSFGKEEYTNRADYFTKHHPACHHQDIHSSYLYEPTDHSKNYFECLQEQDSDMTTNPSSKVTGNSPKADTKEVPDQGEGVLISNIRVPPNIVRDPTVTS
jgi:hypothetical protein